MRLRIRHARFGVYPRVGGETALPVCHLDLVAGLSPRGRGNRVRRIDRLHSRRSIPAWAGKPLRHYDTVVLSYVKDR